MEHVLYSRCVTEIMASKLLSSKEKDRWQQMKEKRQGPDNKWLQKPNELLIIMSFKSQLVNLPSLLMWEWWCICSKGNWGSIKKTHSIIRNQITIYHLAIKSHILCEWVRAEELHPALATHTYTRHTRAWCASKKPISPYAGTGINVEVICFDQLNRHLLELDSNRLQKAQPLPIRLCICVCSCVCVSFAWTQKVSAQWSLNG